ncbi:MAG: sorbosone dehydrogenase family protein [Methylocystis sp.]
MTRSAVLLGAILLASSPALAQTAETYGDWRADAPGVIHKITPADLPAPLASAPAASRSDVTPRPEGASLKTLPGFRVERVATGLEQPRVIRVAPNGDVFVSESAAGRVRLLRFEPGKTEASHSEPFVSGLDRPYGIAFYPPGPDPRFVYVATQSRVLRYPYKSGDVRPSGPAEEIVRVPSGSAHWTRDLAFSPDGATLYVAIGSKSNVAEGRAPFSRVETEALEKAEGVGASAEQGRALVVAFDPDGRNRRVFASGLRNCSGVTIRPGSDELWCVVNERDMLGDDLPPDYATRVTPGAFYGWPWYYIGAHEDPRHKGERPDLADKIATPDVLIQPHSAPLGIAFYEGKQFPPEFRGDAFVALHGSWNRAKRTGYKIIRLRFRDGKPTGTYEDFVTGFVADDDHVWGRPVDVAEAADGSLLFTEDGNGAVWRVSFAPK